MPIYEYSCTRGHRFERVVNTPSIEEPKEMVPCEDSLCLNALHREMARLVPSKTGKPILKKGIGGFHAPNA